MGSVNRNHPRSGPFFSQALLCSAASRGGVQMQHEIILILDFGSQYTQLIARRLRELGVKTVMERGDLEFELIAELRPIARGPLGRPGQRLRRGRIATGGGRVRTGRAGAGHLLRHAPDGAPCSAAAVKSSDLREYGLAELEVVEPGPVFGGTPTRQRVWMSHGDSVSRAPRGLSRSSPAPTTRQLQRSPTRIADSSVSSSTPRCRHTDHGHAILEHFIDIVRGRRDWNPAAIHRETGGGPARGPCRRAG